MNDQDSVTEIIKICLALGIIAGGFTMAFRLAENNQVCYGYNNTCTIDSGARALGRFLMIGSLALGTGILRS